jgi:multidrug efflux pump subunit AcrB
VAVHRELDSAPTEIKRVDARRVINVTADIEEGSGNANEIIAAVSRDVMPGLLADYPGLSYSLEGEQREQAESLGSLRSGAIIALLVIFVLLAIPFGSYFQPLIIMSAIPFGIVGAILGHVVMGYEMSLMSLMGIVALSGIVVNDSLVLIVAINEFREEGQDLLEAVRNGGMRRFRPILLTSLTTFFGLAPMVAETSVQARFLIPMAISLAFGVMFATFIILLLVPCLYLILEDVWTTLDKIRDVMLRHKPADADDEVAGVQEGRLS